MPFLFFSPSGPNTLRWQAPERIRKGTDPHFEDPALPAHMFRDGGETLLVTDATRNTDIIDACRVSDMDACRDHWHTVRMRRANLLQVQEGEQCFEQIKWLKESILWCQVCDTVHSVFCEESLHRQFRTIPLRRFHDKYCYVGIHSVIRLLINIKPRFDLAYDKMLDHEYENILHLSMWLVKKFRLIHNDLQRRHHLFSPQCTHFYIIFP
jgi:hypothetical protein